LPGIGKFFSVLIRYEIGQIERFNSAKKLASYTGLVPSTHSSGNTTRHGKITKAGNRWLRWALVEAVTPATRSSAWLKSYYLGIKSRRCAKDARIATARKIACLIWSVWTEGRAYEHR
jgi:transposase